jgi:hypothetical protein
MGKADKYTENLQSTRILTCWYLSMVNILVSLILYSAHSGSSSYPEIEVPDGGCFMYSLYGKRGLSQCDHRAIKV